MSVYTDEQKQSFDELGYFIVEDAVEPGGGRGAAGDDGEEGHLELAGEGGCV